MNKVWECIVDVFIGILIMFVSVSIYFGLRTESVIKSMYEGITGEFVTDIKNKGVLTLDDYERYMERMGTGNALFNISFEHRYKIYEPEYRFKTLEEIIADQNNAYTGANDYHYRDVVTEKPHVDDPINDGNLNTETNESILAKAVNGPLDPNHVHDDSCYSGHKHTGEPLFTHTHKHDIYSCVQYLSVLRVKYTCSVCKTPHDIVLATWYWDEESRSVKLGYFGGGSTQCYICGSTNVTDFAYVESYAYSCGYDKDIDGDGNTDIVGYDATYQYKRSTPQNISVESTTTNGCYKYHNHVPFPRAGTNAYGNPYYTDKSLREASSFSSYCSNPEYFRIDWDSGGSYFRITYKATNNSNNLIFVGASSNFGNPNIPFPNTMTVSDFSSLINGGGGFLEYHYGISFYDFYDDYYSSLSVTGEISRCSEPTPHNKWYTSCGLEEDGTIDCDKIIVSLTPTHTNQTVYTNDPLITTAKATYKDGSEKTVVCVSDFDTALIGKDQTATLTYTYLIGERAFTKACMIEVTVIPRNRTCSHGHIYNLNTDGSDSGCPYCREWVESLQVINPTTSPIVITIGTSLQDNNVKLLAAYMDGHTEEVSSGYIDNLDRAYLGTKPVTIGYKGASVTVLVTTKCAIMICDICGYEYNLYPDGTNPGCPRCIQRIPIFTGNIMTYEHINHTEEILNMLYEKKRYIFNVDDVFSIRVTNKSSTIARKVLGRVYPSLTDRWLNIEKKEHVMTK